MEATRQPTLMDHFFNMLRRSNTPTVSSEQEEITAEVDEPPDDVVPELSTPFQKDVLYSRANAPQNTRRESLLTRAIRSGSVSSQTSPVLSNITRGMSTTSSHSFSTADLTSDLESPIRSASPSPPPPTQRIRLPSTKTGEVPTSVVVAPITKDDKPVVAEMGEAALEKTLGRKRCIMFACGGADKEAKPEPPKVEEKAEPPKRKCTLTFVCPSRQETKPTAPATKPAETIAAKPAQPNTTASNTHPNNRSTTSVKSPPSVTINSPSAPSPPRKSSFHEFASSHKSTYDWSLKAEEVNRPKLTMDVCLKKENAIRQLGKEAEEEAEEEEREQEELDEELDEEEDEAEDDFAPSDDGNESDDENGFADSDSESENGSEYQFWAPSTTTAATSMDNLTHISTRQQSRSRASSTSSCISDSISTRPRPILPVKSKRVEKMRPGTPELPDSTDFVCGTLDEDRPLEAAFISCREQKRQAKHVPIPQDIDPSFPTSDPEDEEDEEEVEESSDVFWHKDNHFEGFDDDSRGRRASAIKLMSPMNTAAPVIAPPRNVPPVRPQAVTRTSKSPAPAKRLARSPPPKRQAGRSPAPGRLLFDQGPRRMRSPPPSARLRSPRGSPTNAGYPTLGITINRLAQRPNAAKTASLPHTPNPFFRNWQRGSPVTSRIASGAMTPKAEEPRKDLHVRGPVDIVIGLEKKRQKRKDKFWRQHCRKVAKEQAEKRPPPGRGVERMKELGLECAERTRGYGLGQQAQLVLSL